MTAAAAFILLAALAVPAPAPTPTPAVPPAAQPAAPVPTTIADLHAGAACLIGRDPQAGDSLLAAAPYSAAERQLAQRALIEMQRCLRRVPPMTTAAARIRGVLAEQVVERRFPVPPPARTPPVAAAPLLRPAEAAAGVDAAGLAPAYAMAECAVVRRPDLVRALLAAIPASAAAAAAFTALRPVLTACLTGAPRLNLDPPSLRGLLAEDLYRWSVVQRDGPASPWAAPAAAPPVPAPAR